jgi:hypothetical protein
MECRELAAHRFGRGAAENPITGIAGCAPAASGAATTPSARMSMRTGRGRLMPVSGRSAILELIRDASCRRLPMLTRQPNPSLAQPG